MADGKQESIGAIWERDGKGGVFLSGEIEVDGQKVKFVAFRNKYKKEEKHPDWRILAGQERTGQRDPRRVTARDDEMASDNPNQGEPIPF